MEVDPVAPKAEAPGGGGLVFDARAEFFKQISGGLQSDVNAKLVKKAEEEEAAAAHGDGGEEDGGQMDFDEVTQKREQLEREHHRRDRKERSRRDEDRHHSSSSKCNVHLPVATFIALFVLEKQLLLMLSLSFLSLLESSSRRHKDEKHSGRTKEDPEGPSTSAANSFAPTAEEDDHVFEEEPQLNQGVFSALLLAQKKGYVEAQKEKEVCWRFPLILILLNATQHVLLAKNLHLMIPLQPSSDSITRCLL